MADWTLATTRDDHLDEHNLFDHVAMEGGTPGQVLTLDSGKYKPMDAAGVANHGDLGGIASGDHHSEDHASRHTAGGADALSGNLDAVARAAISKGGVLIGNRRGLIFIEGTNVTLTVVDNPGAERVDLTVDSAIASLDDLSDVIITAPINGETLEFNGANWVNVAP